MKKKVERTFGFRERLSDKSSAFVSTNKQTLTNKQRRKKIVFAKFGLSTKFCYVNVRLLFVKVKTR